MNAFDALLERLPVPAWARDDLRARLRDPGRHYHGDAHVALLWERHREFGAGGWATADPWDTRIACAIAFHDGIHDARRQDNEALSVAFWRNAARELDRGAVEWVAGTIEATADHLGARPADGMSAQAWEARAWMLDLDLTPLGETPATFEENARLLRKEHSHLTDAEWEEGRRAFLGRFAAAPRLFRHEVLARTFEAPARRNIEAALRRRE